MRLNDPEIKYIYPVVLPLRITISVCCSIEKKIRIIVVVDNKESLHTRQWKIPEWPWIICASIYLAVRIISSNKRKRDQCYQEKIASFRTGVKSDLHSFMLNRLLQIFNGSVLQGIRQRWARMSEQTGKDVLEIMMFGEVLLAAARVKAALHPLQSIGDEWWRL